jgi:exopolyphosphatase/guanosine-5'-triphosphate,3'-diphosphate pyrophosphatase
VSTVAGTSPRQSIGERRNRWRGQRRGPPACAALDLGTNNCRLLVARPANGGFRVIDAFSRIVRLGEGMEGSGHLSEAAMSRTIDALRVCAGKIRRHRVRQVRSVGTAACRNASNRREFLDRVREETGIAIETISPREEARLTTAGCLPLIDEAAENALVFDIGGGSTELMWLARGESGFEMVDCESLPFGVVSLTERYGQGPFSIESYDRLVADLGGHLTAFCERHAISSGVSRGVVQMLGSSGTVTTLTGLSLELPSYDRSRVDGESLRFEAVREISARLHAMTVDERAALPCIGRDRADMMVAGCAILESICRRWPVGTLRVADRGVREGILCDLIGRDGGRDGQGGNGARP